MSNQNQFEITQKIHQKLDKLAKTTGTKVEIKNDLLVDEEGNIESEEEMDYKDKWGYLTGDYCCLIQETQIRQILIAFEEKLGDNPEYKDNNFCFQNIKKRSFSGEIKDLSLLATLDCLVQKTPKTQSEALCQKWLGGLKPLFDQNPTQVLTEFLEILQNIK